MVAMAQNYKAVYFPDFPAETAKQRSVTLAFGSRSGKLYEYVKDLSSEEIRLLLGSDSYQELRDAAAVQDLPLNTYCLRQLRAAISRLAERRVQYTLPGLDVGRQLFDPLVVTFRGGAKEPFRRWYPYLEGYSPEYVRMIFSEYAPDAHIVLDPFAGTGTTAFTAAEQGKTAYFCEINPVLQFITQVKIHVRRLDSSTRASLADALGEVSKGIEGQLGAFEADYFLSKAYQDTFGDSEFFDESVYTCVLKARSLIDYVAREHPFLADLLTVAILSVLVPCSQMKRAGDLRYKTAREKRTQQVQFIPAIKRAIAQIAQDIQGDVNGLKTEPILLCEDARSLSQLPPLGIDTVITSPPYVNGTNYFRNTKIELWFLRCLHNKHDLATFRAAAVTTGINDVTSRKTPTTCHPEVEKVVRALEQRAYDARIPAMIASYFSEVADIFGIIRNHLTSRATVAIDIGDSSYAGVHVPSDYLLTVCLRDLGYSLSQEIVLRRRKSRSSVPLKQSLLVFKYRQPGQPRRVTETQQFWGPGWETFKERLPHQQQPYARRDWGHALHSLCSYSGKLKPAIAHHLVQTFVPIGGSVLDPFAGVGTIPFEAALQGRLAYGFDLSPVAFVVASAKLQNVAFQDCAKVIQKLKEYIKTNEPIVEELEETRRFGFNGKIAEYYHPETLREVLLARRYFRQHPPETAAEKLVLSCLLHILHGNRPYALSRRSHPLTPYRPSGPFEYRPLVGRLWEKVNRSLKAALPPEFQAGKMFLQDATGWWPRDINGLDAVITSPPFFDSTRFYLANWLRLWFAGWSESDFHTQPLSFVDERQKQSFEIYAPILRQARERLKPGGVVVFHLGKSIKCDMAAHLKEIGKRWFKVADIFDESVAHCESHGIRDKGTVTAHQYLALY